MFRRLADERGLVSRCPYLVSARTAVQTLGLLAGVRHDEAPIERPRQHASKYGPGIIGLPAGGGGELVAPRQEDAAAPTIGQSRQREIRKLLFDQPDLGDVVGPGSLREAAEIFACLITFAELRAG